MRQIALLIFCFQATIVIPQSAPNSTRVADSLEAVNAADKAWQLRDSNPDSSFYYAQRTIDLSSKWHFKTLHAYGLSDLGNYCAIHERYAEAESYLRRSLALRVSTRDTNDIASGYNNLGQLFNQMERFDTASHYFELGLRIAHPVSNSNVRAALLNGMSTSMLRLARHNEAERFLIESIDLGLVQNDSDALAKRYQTLGNLYEQIDRLSSAMEYYDHAGRLYDATGNIRGSTDILINQGALMLRQNMIAKAINKLEEARRLTLDYGFSDNRASLMNNLGLAYFLNGNKAKAEAAYKEGLELASSNGKTRAFAETSINLARLYSANGQHQRLLALLPELLKAINEENLRQFLPEYYSLQAHAYAGTGRFDLAHTSLLSYDQLRDSIDHVVDQAQISLADMETTKRDKEILRQKSQLQESQLLQQQTESEKQTFVWLLIVAVILAVAIAFVVRFYHKNKTLAEKKKSDEKLMNVLRQVDVQLLETQMEANNATSFKIGQNLHDNLGSKLAVVQTSIEGIRKKVAPTDPDIVQRFDKVEAWLEDSCKDLQNIAHDLQDRELKHRGLEQEIQLYAELINEAEGLKVHFIPVNLPKRFHEGTQREIAAIARLLIENVLRHAQAEDVTIRLAHSDESLTLSVEDNGRGFDAEEVMDQEGRGLSNAQLRAEKLGGEFSIISKPGLGTKAKLEIPLNNL